MATMANVTGVSQLMETVGVAPAQNQIPGTPANPDAASERSFATAMRQAKTDAGEPEAPVERKAEAKQSDGGQPANRQGDHTRSARSTQPSAGDGGQAAGVSAAPPATMRYTSANMLAAMLHPSGSTASPDLPSAAGTLLPSNVPDGSPLPALVPVPTPTPTTGSAAGTPSVQDAPAANKPVDVAATPTFVATLQAKPVLKGGASTPVRPSVKADNGIKAAASAATPVLAEAAGAVASTPSLPISVSAGIGPTPEVTPALGAASALSNKAPIGVQGDMSGAQSLVPSTGQPGAMVAGTGGSSVSQLTTGATFEQSLAAQPPAATASQASATGVLSARANGSLAATGHGPAGAVGVLPAQRPAIGSSSQPMEQAWSAAAGGRQAPLASLTEPAVLPVAATVQPPMHGSTQLPLSETQVGRTLQAQAGALHKIAAKASAPTVDTLPVSGEALPAATLPSADGKAVAHQAAPAALVPAPVTMPEAPVASVTVLPVAHTPVAVTALSNPAGPALATTPVMGGTSAPATDSLQHTTLSSTPTTLEVGVANGTHGWLKIRAELNASGTVDASLTGANPTATGRLHNDLSALSSFLQEERVAVGSLNVSAPSAVASALHATAAALEPASSFTRSAAEGVGATGTAVASDAGASGDRAPQQQAPGSSAQSAVVREDGSATRELVVPVSALYGDTNDSGGGLSQGGYGSGGSWLNVRV